MSTSRLLALTAMLLLPATAATAEDGAELRVATDGSGEFETITAAIEASADGDEILLEPGEYVESFIIDKAVTLAGTGAPEDVVIVPEPQASFRRQDVTGVDFTTGIVVDEADATIENLSIRPMDGVDAGILLDGGRPTVRDIETGADIGVNGSTLARIEDSILDGIVLVGPNVRAIVRGNTLRDGVYVDAGATGTVEGNVIVDRPIHIGPDSGLEIIGNTIQPEEDAPAVWVDWANASVDVIGNTIEGGWPGVIVQHGRSARIEGNTITDAAEGIIVLETDAIIRDNTVTNAVDAGIVVEGNGITAEDNTVVGARVGIVAGIPNGYPPNAPRLDEPAQIMGNTVTDASHFGILVFDSAPVVSGNSICAHREPLRLEGDASPQLGSNEFCEVAE